MATWFGPDNAAEASVSLGPAPRPHSVLFCLRRGWRIVKGPCFAVVAFVLILFRFPLQLLCYIHQGANREVAQAATADPSVRRGSCKGKRAEGGRAHMKLKLSSRGAA